MLPYSALPGRGLVSRECGSEQLGYQANEKTLVSKHSASVFKKNPKLASSNFIDIYTNKHEKSFFLSLHSLLHNNCL